MTERGATPLTPPPSPSAMAAADYSMGSEKWLVMTHTDVVLVCLICGFLVMGCVVIYFHQCADRLLARDFAGDRIIRQRRGLDSDVIDAFPRFRYSEVKALTIGNGALECAVCLNEFDDIEEKLRLLPRCCHVFHAHCIDAWLAAHVTCPVCRANLLPGSGGEFHGDSVPSHDPVSNEVTQEIVEINSASRERVAGKFPRSHSTGHSLIQPGGHVNRFTLRLPDRVVTTGLARNPSHKAIQGEMSSRKGYRSISIGTGSEKMNHTYYEGLDIMDRIDRWGFRPTAILFSSGASTRRFKEVSAGDAEDSSTIPRISSTEKDDDFTERSLNKLRPYTPVLSSPL